MTTYSISLDDVDLALLPVRMRSNDFLKKELYEFVIMKTEEDDDDDSSVKEQYKCHICAIEVPSAFSNAHNNGPKHQYNVKITTEATSRMRNLLTSNPPTGAQRGEGFCDPCATIASQDHEKTKEHKLAVVHDRMLNELGNLYVSEDGESNKRNAETKAEAVVNEKKKKVNANVEIIVCDDFENIDTAKDVKPKAPVANKFTQTVKEVTNARMNVCENNIDNINGNDTGKVAKPVVALVANKFTQTAKEVTSSKDAPRATEYVKIPMNMYLRILRTIPITPKIAVKAIGSEVQITVDNIKVIVSSDHYHSFTKNGTQFVCLVCNVLIKPGEEEIHKLSLVHMETILTSVDDANCIRQINQNLSHCIICNHLVNNTRVDEHMATKSHLGKRREALASSMLEELQLPKLVSNVISEVKSQYTYYEPLHQENVVTPPALKENSKEQNVKPNTIEIPNIDKVVLAPNQTLPVKNAAKTKGENVKKIEKTVLEPVKIITEVHSVFPVDERIEYPYEPNDQGSVRCVICSCYVPRTIHNRADHLNGQRHANNVKKHFPPLRGFKKLDSA